MSTATLTAREVITYWVARELGEAEALSRVATAVDEVRALPTLRPPALSTEDRVRMRVDAYAKFGECDPDATVPRWLADSAERLRRHDAETIQRGLALPPAYTTWDELAKAMPPEIWARLWVEFRFAWPWFATKYAHLKPGRSV